jgi:ribonuclease HI
MKGKMVMRLLLYSDGGARGNPGPAAIAYLAVKEKGAIIHSDSRFIGNHTNNQAEYNALIAGLEFAITIKIEEVVCHLDSELVAKQLRGEYTVKNYELQKLWHKVQQLKRCFKKIGFVNVPRSNPQIQRADALVNKTLDEASEKSQ